MKAACAGAVGPRDGRGSQARGMSCVAIEARYASCLARRNEAYVIRRCCASSLTAKLPERVAGHGPNRFEPTWVAVFGLRQAWPRSSPILVWSLDAVVWRTGPALKAPLTSGHVHRPKRERGAGGSRATR